MLGRSYTVQYSGYKALSMFRVVAYCRKREVACLLLMIMTKDYG